MAVRASMEYIIAYVRDLIRDPAAEKFTDQQIQDELDLYRLDLYAEDLKRGRSLVPGNKVEYHDFHSRFGFWEEDAFLQQAAGELVTPDDSNYLLGRWHFDVHQDKQLVATGKVYNLYAVASNLCTMMISDLRDQFNWTADGTTIQHISQARDLQNLARRYSEKAWGWGNTGQITLKRKDIRG